MARALPEHTRCLGLLLLAAAGHAWPVGVHAQADDLYEAPLGLDEDSDEGAALKDGSDGATSGGVDEASEDAAEELASGDDLGAGDAPDAPMVAPGSEPTGTKAAGRAAWLLRMSAGLGIGTRAFDLPGDGVIYQTRTGLFPAVGLGLQLHHALSPSFSFGLLVRYQTSVGATIEERQTDGGGHIQNLRSHHLELGLAHGIALDDEGHWALNFAAGYSVNDLRPEIHLLTPAYGLGGPYLRSSLQAPIVPGLLRVRLGPEGQWIAHASGELPEWGVQTQGFGVGGEAALELTLRANWIVGATYREFRRWLDGSGGDGLSDVSRFLTLRLTGVL